MKRWAIKGIIALMSLALIGIIAIQAYWLSFSIRLNEQKFDQNVAAAMFALKEEIEDVFRPDDSDFRGTQKLRQPRSSSFLRVDYFFGRGILDSNFVAGRYVEQQQQQTVEDVMNLLSSYPIEDLLDPRMLNLRLNQHLQDRGVRAKFVSGVYSYSRAAMVIYDGHYVGFLDGEARYSDPELELPDKYKMDDAQYKIDLFGMGDGALGQFRLYFPNRSRVLWQDSWWLLAASLFFTCLILFAFSYTVYVILQQKKVSEMKNDFINNMTHEFKTPIATISLATDSLTSEKIIAHPDKIRRFASIITQENRRMLSQVEKVLQMALIDQRDFGLQMEEVALHELIAEAVDYIRMQVEKRGGQVEMDLRAKQSIVRADRTHISNIFHNLLDNANKYSPNTPKIRVETANVSDGVEIRVIDHGLGMTREARKQIFEKFFRVHTGNIHDVKGFGLGLSYVKAIVTAHEGNIDVESEPGRGSTFTVFLPFNM